MSLRRLVGKSFRRECQKFPKETEKILVEGLRSGEMPRSDFSVRELFECFVRTDKGDLGGHEIVESWRNGADGHSVALLEAGGAVETSAFTNIVGQYAYTAMLEGFEDPTLLWPQVSTTVPTQFDGERIPGISPIGDEALAVGEGQPYPHAAVTEQFKDTPRTTKRGHLVELTKEAVFFDRTNQLEQRASEVGKWLGVNKEKRILDVAVGVTNNHVYKGTSETTYANSHTVGDFDNLSASTALIDWTDLDEVEQLFAEITHPETGEPISIKPTQLLVPSGLVHTANRIVNATQLIYGTPGETTNPTTGHDSNNTQTVSPSPRFPYAILSNQYVSDRQGNQTTWHLGDFKKAVYYMENWPITVTEAPTNNELEFTRDIVKRWKGSERGVAYMFEPRFVAQATA